MKLYQKFAVAAATAALGFSVMESALADSFTTTLTLEETVGNPPFDSVVMMWSTSVEQGLIRDEDLDEWRYELRNGAQVIYAETVISGGVVQPIGGAERGFAAFEFDLDSLTLDLFDNDPPVRQEDAAKGVTYSIAYTPIWDGKILIIKFVNGFFSARDIEMLPFDAKTTRNN
ncbi:MAG: hypothetical protein RIM23_16425 [Coleofasciculus sp. G3-WIS-01]|uniref:PEP-CTERM sorting domain-containing protein n=1 Tax=Coleofasciculus sp. G3-WIS-01 TaxID=3069528 RepID=UPI0032F44D27